MSDDLFYWENIRSLGKDEYEDTIATMDSDELVKQLSEANHGLANVILEKEKFVKWSLINTTGMISLAVVMLVYLTI